jgi:glycosyltransferase involved in cell wall biosynthesis
LKILIVTSKIPYPPHRGDRLKIYNICRLLLKNNNIKILTFYRNEAELKDVEILKQNGFDIEAISLAFYKSVLNLNKAAFSSMPMQVSAFYSKQMHKKISELTAKENYDVVYFHLLVIAQYLDAVKNKNILKVLDFTDAISLYLERYLEFISNPLKRIIYKIELNKTIKYENIAKKFDTLFVCSDADRIYLMQKQKNTNIQLLLNGVDLETFSYVKTEPEENRIIFVGNMEYFPNIDAVFYFSNEIFPLIKKKRPSARFYIVGKGASKKVRDLQSDSIVVKGFVDNLQKEYLISKVNVAPIRLGAGFPNKIIEALVLGVPTVASKTSFEGLPDELKEFVLPADNPEDFADKVINVLQDDKFKIKLIEEGINRIRETLNWEKIVGEFENYLESKIAKH